MNLGVLFSGGKDSCYACYEAMKDHTVSCLISMVSSNEESYMFHTVNIGLTRMQAEAMELPAVVRYTEGKKEIELEDLTRAIETAKEQHELDGIVSGAIASTYQRSRIEKICTKLDLQSFTPLWKRDQITLLNEIISAGFKTLITGVFAYPFDESWLGRELDESALDDLERLYGKYGINPSGEGGEIETFVYDGSLFTKRIAVLDASKRYAHYAGVYTIERARLETK